MNVGDIVVVKLTGEPVLVTDPDFVSEKGSFIEVRRAVQTDAGIQYELHGFQDYELVSQEEWFKQDLEIKFRFHEIRESFERRLVKANPDTAVASDPLSIN